MSRQHVGIFNNLTLDRSKYLGISLLSTERSDTLIPSSQTKKAKGDLNFQTLAIWINVLPTGLLAQPNSSVYAIAQLV